MYKMEPQRSTLHAILPSCPGGEETLPVSGAQPLVKHEIYMRVCVCVLAITSPVKLTDPV